ncbi:MAG: PilT/PilU family type 4a pilus ATPase [Patescibacteria group bacterium]|nr:PilT/PilU family type 4a pilus ATPase [Patescibacteria group bacterium]
MTLDELFRIAVDRKASDLHLVVGLPPIVRIDGALQQLSAKPKLTATEIRSLLNSILTEKQKTILENEKELDLSYELRGAGRFRVNCHWEKDCLGMVARVISKDIPTLEHINVPPIVYDLLQLQQGLILVTGPTGCGKSTTLAAMINHINIQRSVNIITLEDPIEFVFTPIKSIIKQRQLNTDMLSFGNALVHVLRQDPNVIMVGEMRDLETIGTTITLAETGHLVLATLHTHNAAQTMDRIIDIFPPHQQPQIRLQLSITLRAILSQRLIPRKEGGRVATREVLINTPAVANLVRENKIAQIKSVLQTSAEEGMVTMDQDLINLYRKEEISKETAQFHMLNPELLD